MKLKKREIFSCAEKLSLQDFLFCLFALFSFSADANASVV